MGISVNYREFMKEVWARDFSAPLSVFIKWWLKISSF
jgi:hypothetical protein